MSEAPPRGTEDRAGHGAVAAGHPGTAGAAADVLAAGGTAFDALIAAALAASVCEPVLFGPGGGGLITARDAGSGRVEVVDCFGSFPGLGAGLAARDFRSLQIDYGPTTQLFHVGPGSVAVPGILPGLEAFWRRYGTLPLARLAAPAIRLAREGWEPTPTTAMVCSMLRGILEMSPESAALFVPGGRPLQVGQQVRSEPMARALLDFAAEGAEPFLRGRHADALLRAFGPPHGSLTREDLDAYEVRFLTPLPVRYQHATLFVPGPPCTGGPLLAFGLRLLDLLDESEGDGDSPLELGRRLATVMAETGRARAEGWDRGMFEEGAVERLLDPENLARHADRARLDMARDRAAAAAGAGGSGGSGSGSGPKRGAPPPGPIPGNTSHISVVDGRGNAAAMTASNGESCGLLWPGTEFPVNNFLGEEDIHPLGLHLGPAGARFRTMMTPSLLVEADGGVLALGTGGSNRIRTAMLQVVRHIVGDREDPGRAVLHPRIHVEGDSVQVEVVNIPDGFVAAVAGTSRRPGCFDRLHLYFGGVHVAARRGDGGLEAVGDPRRDGVGRVV